VLKLFSGETYSSIPPGQFAGCKSAWGATRPRQQSALASCEAKRALLVFTPGDLLKTCWGREQVITMVNALKLPAAHGLQLLLLLLAVLSSVQCFPAAVAPAAAMLPHTGRRNSTACGCTLATLQINTHLSGCQRASLSSRPLQQCRLIQPRQGASYFMARCAHAAGTSTEASQAEMIGSLLPGKQSQGLSSRRLAAHDSRTTTATAAGLTTTAGARGLTGDIATPTPRIMPIINSDALHAFATGIKTPAPTPTRQGLGQVVPFDPTPPPTCSPQQSKAAAAEVQAIFAHAKNPTAAAVEAAGVPCAP
jgi:hypothetical protein